MGRAVMKLPEATRIWAPAMGVAAAQALRLQLGLDLRPGAERGERGERRGLGPQDARTEPYRNEAVAREGGFFFGVESGLRPGCDGRGLFDSFAHLGESQLGPRRQQDLYAVFFRAIDRRHERPNPGYLVAPALLAGSDRDFLP